MGPPTNVLGVAVPIRLVLAKTPEVAVAVQHVTAFPSGLRFDLLIARRKPPEDHLDDPLHRFHLMRHAYRGGELPPELLRFGVQFADGSKATTLRPHPFVDGPDKEPESPLLLEHGGGGGGPLWTMGYWLWPLPPVGPLAFVVEWPAEGIEETRVETAAGPIREAATQAETLWPEERGAGGSMSSRRQVDFFADFAADEAETPDG
jgi:hypothetical protein